MRHLNALFLCSTLLMASASALCALHEDRGDFETLTSDLGIFRDVVNVGVLQRNGKTLLIDCGEGRILGRVRALKLGPIEWVLATHHHRDQVSGLGRLKSAGARVAVPAAEWEYFAEAEKFWSTTADRILYQRLSFRNSLFTLRESVTPDRALKDGDTFNWQGIPIAVLSTPGHTDGSLTYIVNL